LKQINVFKEEKVDFIIAEYFEHTKECEIAIKTIKDNTDFAIAANLCVGPEGDMHGMSVEDSALRL